MPISIMVKEAEMDKGYDTHVGFGGESHKEIDHWEDVGVDRRIMLKWMFEKYAVEWTGLI
jgi:hypothetical protein